MSLRAKFLTFPVVFGALAVAGAGMFLVRAASGPALWGGSVENRHTHVLRLQADMTVDGHPVRFDEHVECRAFGRHVERAGRDHLPRVVLQRRRIARKLPGGSGVILPVSPKLCWQWQRLWLPERKLGRDRTPPPNYLPPLYWVDDLQQPSRIEMAVSEAYYQSPKARIRLRNFDVSLAAFPPPAAIIRRARSQAKRDPPTAHIFKRRCRFRSLTGLACWRADYLRPASRSDLLATSETKAYVESLPGTTLFVIPPTTFRSAYRKVVRHRYVDWSVLSHGIPRSGDRHGLLDLRSQDAMQTDRRWKTRIYVTADDVVPIVCRGDTCTADSSARGYLVFHRRKQGSTDAWYRRFVYRQKTFPFGALFRKRFLHDSEDRLLLQHMAVWLPSAVGPWTLETLQKVDSEGRRRYFAA